MSLSIDLRAQLANASNPKERAAVLQQQIDAVAQTGGGQVRVPPGEWVITTLVLRSGITLHLERGAILAAHGDLNDYPALPVLDWSESNSAHNYHLILAQNAEDITIEGDGIIDGRGEQFWEEPIRDIKARGEDVSDIIARAPKHWPINGPWWRGWKPRITPLIEISWCRRVTLRDVTIRNSPGWTVHPYCCDDVRISGLTIANHMFGPNTDGIDVNGCRDVTISDCRIRCCDDAIILKATRGARSTERVTVTNCVLSTHCAALGLGAETAKSIRDVAFSNCVVERALRMIQFQMWEPGIIENVVITNISGATLTPDDIPMEKVVYMDIQSHGRKDPELGHIRNVVIQGITARTQGRCIMTAKNGATMRNITLRDIHLTYPAIEDSAKLAPVNRSNQNNNDNPIAKATNAVLVAENIENLTVENLTADLPPADEVNPAMHGGFLRNIKGLNLNCPFLSSNKEGHDTWVID